MSNPPIDHERDCVIAITQAFLADVDRDGLGAVGPRRPPR